MCVPPLFLTTQRWLDQRSEMTNIKWLHYRPSPSSYPISFLGWQFITMIPREQQVTPNSGSLQATVLVGGQGMEIVPGRHPLPTTDFYATLNTESFAPARAELGPYRHPYSTPHLCDNKAPYFTWLHVISKLNPGTGRSESAGWQCVVVTCAMPGIFLLLCRQWLLPEGIETHDGSLFLRAARLTFDLLGCVHVDGRTGGL